MAVSMGMIGGRLIDRDVLAVPEVLAETYAFSPLQTKPLLDTVWNASGWGGTLNLNENGDWIESR